MSEWGGKEICILFVFYKIFVVHVPRIQDSSYLLLQVGTHADVGNVEF